MSKWRPARRYAASPNEPANPNMNGSADFPIVVLISGGGTTLRNLIQVRAQGGLAARIAGVISSSAQAGGVQYAREAAIPTHVVRRQECDDDLEFSQKVFDLCRRLGGRLVVMGGFLKRLPIANDFVNRVINIHPSLIPAFCGRGFYGRRVHQAVLEYGAKISGCTVHFVDDQYDHGPVILQRAVNVHEDDSPQTLADRVFEQECEVYPHAINLIANGQVQVEGRRVRVSA